MYSNALIMVICLLMAALVILLPVIDISVCRLCGVHPWKTGGETPGKRRLLRLRKFILYSIFAVYALAVAYLVFFSRAAIEEYRINITFMQDLRDAISFDTTYLGVIAIIFQYGLKEGLSLIHIENMEDVSQVLMNIMLFVPLGYLLPYCFPSQRTRTVFRITMMGFAISFVIENLQLVFKRGFYDADDLLANTIGAFLGALLYRSIAFFITHPEWRKDLRESRKWKRHIRKHRIYAFAKDSVSSRVKVYCSDPSLAHDFFSNSLGLKLIGQRTDPPGGRSYLFSMGGAEMEVICAKSLLIPQGQSLNIRVKNLDRVHRRLRRRGFQVSEYSSDPYSDLREFTIPGPDGLTVVITG